MKKSIALFAVALAAYLIHSHAPELSLPDTDTIFGALAPESSAASAEESSDDENPAARPARPKGVEIPAYLTDRPEEVIAHEGYTVSFNRKHKLPNWVAWVLTRERTRGTVKRNDQFQPDPDVRKGATAEDADYRGSGYDRGHMCPAADNKFSRQAMLESCYLSNICPQTHSLNGGDWKELEEKCRRWAVQYDSLYIVCGPVPPGDKPATIGAGRVSVPEAFYKVVLRIDGDGRARAIGFVCRQDDKNHPLSHYAITVDEVERLTGINFFSKLPEHQERRAEAAYDIKDWAGLK